MKTSYNSFYAELEGACARIVSASGDLVEVDMKKTEYVLPGHTVEITTKHGSSFPFWVGVNGPRIFFIAYVTAEPTEAKNAFQFCFGGAQKVGWEMNYEGINSGTSIWATVMTDKTRPLIAGSELTDEGHFWATDIAMMVQSWVRTCERLNIKRHELDPAPL